MDYQLLAQEVIRLMGGKENIATHTHCVTRLRFQVNNRSLINEEELKKVKGVRGLMYAGGIYQVIIGADVDKAYVYVKEILGEANSLPKVEIQVEKAKWYETVLNYISASIAPALPVLTFTGFTLVILNLLTMFNLMDNTGSTYTILNTFANAGLYYLPVFVAIGAARRCKCSEVAAAMLAVMTLHPSFLGVEGLSFSGFNVMQVQYNSNILPMLLTVPCYAWIEHKLNDYLPTLVRNILKPLLSIGIVIPLILFVTGPIGSIIAKALANLMVAISNYGAISLGLMTLVNPILVMTGMHTILIPVGIQEMMTVGYSTILARGLPYNMAVAGSAFGTWFILKKKENKDEAFSTAITAFLGTSEPALYGTLIRYRTPFIATMLGGGIGGFVGGLLKLKLFVAAAPSILTLPAFISADYPSNIIVAIVVSIVAFIAAFIITCLMKVKED